MKKIYLIILIVLFAVGYLFSASPTVENIMVTPESGRVVISYDLTAEAECRITLLVSDDEGATYNIFPEALTGDVGDSVVSGLAKEIIWQPSADGMEIGVNYRVKIIARDNPVIPTNPLGAEEIDSFVKITGGTFNNGTADVTISDFYMSKYEVTQAEYEAVMGSNPSSFFGSDKPVERVSWYNAIEYCNARSLQEGLTPCYDTSDWSCDFTANGYRLPTEMEWMFAAKGGNEEPATGYNQYAGTNVESELTDYAWYWSNSSDGTKQVGTKLPNQLGLYDMSGNVWEWCNDRYADYSSSAQTDPVGPTSGSFRVQRGGSWYYYANFCRVANRGHIDPSSSYYNIGFRLVRSIPESVPQVVTDPVISSEGGNFEEAQTITITCETTDAQIYYTIDGTEPDQASTLYTQAFELIESATVKARAYKDSWDASAVVSAEYVININIPVPVPEGFVLVEGGTFNNGTANVTLSSFYMSKYEITNTQFIEFLNSYGVASNGSMFGVELIDMDENNCAIGYTNGSFYFSSSSFATNIECPVIEVTWYGSAAYSNWLSFQEGLTPCYNTLDWSCDFTANGYRLPTEMEWMYAAKGGNETPATVYNQWAGTNVESELTNYAWYNSISNSTTHNVGTKLPNQLGLYDMSGNVLERCNDWYSAYSSSPQTDPVGPASGSDRVLRGGSWSSSAPYCRVSGRGYYYPSGSSGNIGFRLARSSE